MTITSDDQPSQFGAIFLSEYFAELNEGAGFLTDLSQEDLKRVRSLGSRSRFEKGEGIFHQGAPHTGVWIIESGRVRTYYAGPSGREITLAYWSSGHFVGGPEVFARGRHVWSADALEPCELLFLSGTSLLKLVREVPDVAVGVIEGLVAKGKSYSALIQMLGTRSVSERLSQLLVILANTTGRPEGDTIVVDRTVTYEQIAAIVGATRQWVTQSLDKLKAAGVVEITRTEIIIRDLEQLEE
ncbi:MULTISPECIES: Crp/Fnr family transcriptional regulator [unclassified Shimia]|uniref:Crp/Fnr family transcriptional regulator n=1 Tax=unclassified Shimia TaxID=2630038 RepID=UPI0031032C81